LRYLNNDDIPDFIFTGGCCGGWTKEIYLGDKNGDFKLNKTISCDSESPSNSDELCDEKKLKEYYSKN
jgi:hypothetical protein